jgi:hypothetical protein
VSLSFVGFSQRNFAPGSPSNDDRPLGRPTASPFLSLVLDLIARLEITASSQNRGTSRARRVKLLLPPPTQQQPTKCPSVGQGGEYLRKTEGRKEKGVAKQSDARPQPPSPQYACPSHCAMCLSLMWQFNDAALPVHIASTRSSNTVITEPLPSSSAFRFSKMDRCGFMPLPPAAVPERKPAC